MPKTKILLLLIILVIFMITGCNVQQINAQPEDASVEEKNEEIEEFTYSRG